MKEQVLLLVLLQQFYDAVIHSVIGIPVFFLYIDFETFKDKTDQIHDLCRRFAGPLLYPFLGYGYDLMGSQIADTLFHMDQGVHPVGDRPVRTFFLDQRIDMDGVYVTVPERGKGFV